MEVQLTPELEARLQDEVAASARDSDELLQDAVTGYLAELAQTREMLDSRYDDIISGRVTALDGEEVFAELRRMSEERRAIFEMNRP